MKKLACLLAGLMALACSPASAQVNAPIYKSANTPLPAQGVFILDTTGAALGTSGNPIYTSGGGGSGGAVTQGAGNSSNPWYVAQSGTWNLTNITGAITLPTGAATSALQTTGNTSLSAISGQLPASLGVKTGALSRSVAPNTDTPFPTYLNVSSASAQALTAVSAAGASSSVLKASAGNIYGFNLVNNTTAIFAIVYDASTAPTSGTALTTASIKYCFPVAASAGFDKVFNPPVRVTTGAVLLASTSCTTYTAPASLPIVLIGEAQ